MKKIFCILSILTIVSPISARADVVAGTPSHADPATLAKDGNNNTINPGYALINSHDNDTNAASAGYVKGAYNATIKAVNTVNSIKQDKLTSTNVTTSGSGPVVTAVTANNGAVTVSKGEIQIPVGSASSPTDHATVWIQ